MLYTFVVIYKLLFGILVLNLPNYESKEWNSKHHFTNLSYLLLHEMILDWRFLHYYFIRNVIDSNNRSRNNKFHWTKKLSASYFDQFCNLLKKFNELSEIQRIV
jgi:hypothetical protein